MSRPCKMSGLKTADQLEARLSELGIELPLEADLEAPGPLGAQASVGGHAIGNRFTVLPMEGWDGTAEGRPTDLVRRRWRRFGESGAKLVWGGEAYAVERAARANPRQLARNAETEADLADLRSCVAEAHRTHAGRTDDLLLGLQLTHSGRFARPEGTPAPRVAYRHALLDRRVGIEDDAAVLSDAELDDLIGAFVAVARLARDAGFQFVDVKACHGYLLHELLSGRERAGRYGGERLEDRARFLLATIDAIRTEAPELAIGVRLSIFDHRPFAAGDDGIGRPEPTHHRPFGTSADGLDVDLGETHELVDRLAAAGVSMLCTTAGSPYYTPHIQRPAFYPPSDGYGPPEDPLVGVARQIEATRAVKERHPNVFVVGSGYTYLQEWLPHVAQATVRTGGVDSVGLGRMVLSYPDLPRDVIAGRPLQRRAICRTFSDCTTAPRNGLVSGCYPLDPFYKRREEASTLAEIKKRVRPVG